MNVSEERERVLIEKLRELPPGRLAEVEDFVDFLRHRAHDGQLSSDFTKRSEEAFRKIWDNPDDDVYDRL